jgi:hypothetical protein
MVHKISAKLEAKMQKIIDDNTVVTITPKSFRNKRTGEIVTQFSILDINDYEEVKD